MKIISDNKRAEIILSDKDSVVIKVLNKNNMKMVIRCIGETLHMEEDMEVIHDKLEEDLAIRAMDEYLKTYDN